MLNVFTPKFGEEMKNQLGGMSFELLAGVSSNFAAGVLAERGMGHSDETRLANLLRRVSREDDRDRRLTNLKQLKEFISHGESKVVSKTIHK